MVASAALLLYLAYGYKGAKDAINTETLRVGEALGAILYVIFALVLIFANITADILMRLSSSIGKHLNEGGIIVLSGIINTRLDEVVECYENAGYEIIDRAEREDWRALKLKRV